MTSKPAPLDNDYKLKYIAYYLETKLGATNKMEVLLRKMLMQTVLPDEVYLENANNLVTGRRDQLWLFEDVLRFLKIQPLSAEQQRVADHLLVEVNYYHQALAKNLHLIEELQGTGRE